MDIALGGIVGFLFRVFVVILVLIIWASTRSSSKLQAARKAVIESIEKSAVRV